MKKNNIGRRRIIHEECRHLRENVSKNMILHKIPRCLAFTTDGPPDGHSGLQKQL